MRTNPKSNPRKNKETQKMMKIPLLFTVLIHSNQACHCR